MAKIIYTAGVRIPTEKAHGINIMKMCEAFAVLGHRVELVVPRRFNKISQDPFEYYGVKRIFRITKLPCLDLIPFDRYLGRAGLYVMEASFSFSLCLYLLFKKAEIFYIRDKLLLPITLIKENCLFEAHTFPANYSLYRPFIKRLKGIVAITQKLKEQFLGQALVAPDGVDLAKFEIRSTKFETREILKLPQDKKIVLYAGHLYPWKGVDVLAEASQYLAEDTEVYFVGGTEKDIQSFKIRCLNFKKVRIVGHKPHKEIPYWLKASDVLVLPNSGKEEISRHWTSPLKMFEYMAAQRPIVASDLPSIREIINIANAILVKPDNPLDLAAGIKQILGNRELSDKILTQAFDDVKEYTWEKRAQKIYEYFNQIKGK